MSAFRLLEGDAFSRHGRVPIHVHHAVAVPGRGGAMKPIVLWHGGVGGLRRGGIIKPDMAEHRYVEGCPHCEAQRNGTWAPGEDPGTPPGFVYATSDREYARWYASRAVRGTLYRVELLDAEPSAADKFPSWRGSSARVLEVEERNIILTWAQRRRIFIRSLFGRGAEVEP